MNEFHIHQNMLLTAAAWVDMLAVLALLCSLYVSGACVCRLGSMDASVSRLWVLLYGGVFSNAVWQINDILTAGISVRECVQALFVAAYMQMTAAAWSGGAPAIAKRRRACP